LYNECATYSIGEQIRAKLQILNDTNQEVKFGNGFIFDWENLAFVEPNFVHLVGPSRTELALQYRCEQSYFNLVNNPINVEGSNEEWLYLPIHAHFHLRELGEYTFWLELLDNHGELHHSNQISFQLVDIEPSMSPDLIELTLESRKCTFAVTEDTDVEVVFKNKFDRPVIFLKPQEDSFYGWVNPVYQFTIFDSVGRNLSMALRSGTMPFPIYDETTQFTVTPGESYRQMLHLPDFPKIKNAGEYRLRLTYIVREKAIGKGGVVLDKQMNWKEGVFIGRIESNELAITVK
jgi:hypothetical protein